MVVLASYKKSDVNVQIAIIFKSNRN